MEENNYTYQNIKDIKVDSKHIETIMFKPRESQYICIALGIILFFVNHILARILGVFFVVMAFLVIYFVKDRKVAEIYETGIVIYNPVDIDLAYFINYGDVSMWEVNHDNGHDSIILTLNDQRRAVFDSFQISKAYNALDKVIHDKEKRAIEAKKNKEKHWEIRNPFKRKK